MIDFITDNPYLLLTPGPLTTSKGVKSAMLQDWSTWDEDYNLGIVQNVRRRLVELATDDTENYTAVLLQGSGSFAVEACMGTAVAPSDKILIIVNGAYGKRMADMAHILGLKHRCLIYGEDQIPQLDQIGKMLEKDGSITHVAVVHCETTTGILNPLEDIAALVKGYGKTFIVDAMSSFGGIPFDVSHMGIDYLISSSNKCIQGVPGFAFVIAKRSALSGCKGNSHSLVLDLYDQWEHMDKTGKWRYTSPTHVVRAFCQALDELEEEGGIPKRYERYCENHRILVEGMGRMGFKTLLEDNIQSPIITAFLYPGKDFSKFYREIKKKGFVICPGKLTQLDTFRIGNIGEVYSQYIFRLLDAIGEVTK